MLNRQHLQALGLDIDLLKAMPKEQQEKEIKKAWRRLVLIHHPDKGGDAETFRSVNEAYIALTTGRATNPNTNDVQAYDIDKYFTKSELPIQNDAFDMPMQEGIAEVFSNLRRDFRKLSDDDSKRKFAQYYASFITLAEELEKRDRELTRLRADALLYQQRKQTIRERMIHEWKVLVIRLFAEEYLDDFQYRDALANGDFSSILAIRKLLTPIKWLALITASLELSFRCTGEQLIMRGRDGSLLYLLESPISLVNFLVELSATPVNSLIRPLANVTGISPALYASIFSVAGAGIIYGLMSGLLTLSFASIQFALPIVTVALNLYSIYVTYQTVENLKAANRDQEAKQTAALFGFIILMNFLPKPSLAFHFMFNVGCLCLFNAYKNLAAENPMEFLPLPSKTVSEELKNATLLGYTKANQSHRFFGTPKDANFDNQRSFWQKTSSFFGVDHAKSKEPKPQFGAAEQLLSLEYAK